MSQQAIEIAMKQLSGLGLEWGAKQFVVVGMKVHGFAPRSEHEDGVELDIRFKTTMDESSADVCQMIAETLSNVVNEYRSRANKLRGGKDGPGK